MTYSNNIILFYIYIYIYIYIYTLTILFYYIYIYIYIGLSVNIGKTKYMEIGRHRGIIANAHIKIGSNSYENWKRLNT